MLAHDVSAGAMRCRRMTFRRLRVTVHIAVGDSAPDYIALTGRRQPGIGGAVKPASSERS